MKLRVVSSTGDRPPAQYRATAEAVEFDAGFHGLERDDVYRFRWMGESGELVFAPRDANRFLELWVFSCFKDLSQQISFEAASQQETLPLAEGWCRLSVAVPARCDRLALTANKLYPPSLYPGDPRSLAIRVRDGVFLHRDPERHRHIQHQYRNRIANVGEMLAGEAVLKSTPNVLGIDMHGVCNVKPPCVYCEWDISKEMEGANVDVPFTVKTLDDWGEIFNGADTLVNCSIGEPFMMKNLDELFDIFGDQGKALEMTTNGQILTERNIEKLLDREIDLYISLDAATPETYARLRNNTLERILNNIRRLIAAKGGRAGLPRVHLVFMPMRCNLHELEAFVELCDELQVDRLVLRPLNFSDGIALNWEREGYTFDYPKELLPFDELIRVSSWTAELCREKGVPLSDQMDFGVAMDEIFKPGLEDVVREEIPEEIPTESPSEPPADTGVEPARISLGDEKLPLCTEPWTSLYILRRGILPCCYGGHPLAEMDEFETAWNGRKVRAIRAALAGGKFHRYCLRSPACPIVRKGKHAGSLPVLQAVFLRAREFLQRVDRRFFGVPGSVYRPLKRTAKRLLGR